MEKVTLTGQLMQYIFGGITTGSIYAMVALGFNFIYNTTEILNLAQGEFVMLGGLFMVFLTVILRLPLILGFCLSIVIVTLIGCVFERLAIHPVRKAPVITLIIITLSGSIIFQGIAMLIWGKEPFSSSAFTGSKPIIILGASILPQTLWVLGITLLVVLVLTFIFEHTLLGKAMIATADNPEAAGSVGINIRRMVLLSFALSAAVGAIAGTVVTPISLMEFDRGPMLTIKGFSAAALGGLGSSVGAVVGGFLMGIIEALCAGLISSAFKDAVALVILLLVIFLKPNGLFGKSLDVFRF